MRRPISCVRQAPAVAFVSRLIVAFGAMTAPSDKWPAHEELAASLDRDGGWRRVFKNDDWVA